MVYIYNEAITLNQLAIQEGVQISPCGLFIYSEIPFLAATPDDHQDYTK